MSRWSESIYSEPNSSRDMQGFLTQLDARLYEGVPMNDPQLDAEAAEWAKRFLHLRVRGVKCTISKPQPIRSGKSVEIDPQAAAKTPPMHLSKTSTLKKSSTSPAQSRSASDHLPKLKDLRK